MHQDSGHGGSCGIYDEFIDEHHRQCERVASGVRAMREGGPWRQGILIFEGVAASSESVDPAAGGQVCLFLPDRRLTCAWSSALRLNAMWNRGMWNRVECEWRIERGDAVGGERPDRALTGAAPNTALEKLSSAR